MENFVADHFLPQLSIDSVIFGYKTQELKVLVSKIKTSPALWTLPGGFIKKNESIDDAALRILAERTSIKDIYLEQFRVFGNANRINFEVFDNLNKFYEGTEMNISVQKNMEWLSKRFVSIGYYALVDINRVNPQKGFFDESVEWYDIKTLPPMILDHNEIVVFALEALRQNFDQKLIGLNLLPETFTMRELQELYEAVYDKPFARNNFQKKILDLNVLERLEKKYTGAANKAPYLYRFKRAIND